MPNFHLHLNIEFPSFINSIFVYLAMNLSDSNISAIFPSDNQQVDALDISFDRQNGNLVEHRLGHLDDVKSSHSEASVGDEFELLNPKRYSYGWFYVG